MGEEIWNDGAKYEGIYKNGKKNGKGKFEWPDGSYYLGEFVENEIEGEGNYFWYYFLIS